MPEIPDSLMRLMRLLLGELAEPPRPERVPLGRDPLAIAAQRSDRVEAEAWATIERVREERQRMDPARAIRRARERREDYAR